MLPLDPYYRAIVVGYGPVGQTVTRLLRDNGIAPIIIELNRDTVHRLREAGVSAIYGDASHRETLQGAGVERAGSLILSAAGMSASAEVIRLARELNPSIRILARAAYAREIPPLYQAGAERVFSGEVEVALAFTEAILRTLGATPDQIDQERDRFIGTSLTSPRSPHSRMPPTASRGTQAMQAIRAAIVWPSSVVSCRCVAPSRLQIVAPWT